MIQSITFYETIDDILLDYYNDPSREAAECKNTWDDWHILASSRPVFTPPEVKTTYIDVPGGNGSLDLTESLARYPTYENRSGNFKFKVMNEYKKDDIYILESNNKGRWAERYSEMMDYLHGKALYAVLDDDPEWFYQGRFSVESWESADTWSEITIGYSVNPFKWRILSSTDDWLWDPFNFETGVIWDVLCTDINVDTETTLSLPTSLQSIDSTTYSMKDFFGNVPISPTITYTPKCPTHKVDFVYDEGSKIWKCPNSSCGQVDKGMEIHFTNSYLNIDLTQTFKAGTTFVPDFIFYGQTEPYEIILTGNGTVSIDFRIGRL